MVRDEAIAHILTCLFALAFVIFGAYDLFEYNVVTKFSWKVDLVLKRNGIRTTKYGA